MIKPGPRNLITDLEGLKVGNAQDIELFSGTTAVLPDKPCPMAVDVRGGGPGTRDTDALDPTCLVEAFHGLVLSGGSVFGLAAADGAAGWLSDRGIGLPISPKPVPVVPAAILFDLANPVPVATSANLMIDADLIVSPEFAQDLLDLDLADDNLTGADVGDARVMAIIPDPSAAGLALIGLATLSGAFAWRRRAR